MACEAELEAKQEKEVSLETALLSVAQLTDVAAAALEALQAAITPQQIEAAWAALNAALVQLNAAVAVAEQKRQELQAAINALKLCQNNTNSPNPPGP